jgi:hypothetical protein
VLSRTRRVLWLDDARLGKIGNRKHRLWAERTRPDHNHSSYGWRVVDDDEYQGWSRGQNRRVRGHLADMQCRSVGPCIAGVRGVELDESLTHVLQRNP